MMISLEADQPISTSIQPASSPRISFSAGGLLDDNNFFVPTSPNPKSQKDIETDHRDEGCNVEFEFLSSNSSATDTMLTADKLFFEGKLLPFWQMQHMEKLTLKPKDEEEKGKKEIKEESRVCWLADEDPSPRPPKCTVLLKELLRLKKQHTSPSSSSSGADMGSLDDGKEGKEGMWSREKHVKRIKKGLERTRSSASIIIKPVFNVPAFTQGKTTSILPLLFSLKKGNVER